MKILALAVVPLATDPDFVDVLYPLCDVIKPPKDITQRLVYFRLILKHGILRCSQLIALNSAYLGILIPRLQGARRLLLLSLLDDLVPRPRLGHGCDSLLLRHLSF